MVAGPVVVGPVGAGPGVKAGPGRVSAGDENLAASAALWGGALARSSNASDLPRGPADTAEPLPEAVVGGPAGTAEAGTGPGVGALGHREGSLPAQVVAVRGAGGLGGIPGPGPAGLGDVPALGPAGLSGVPAAGAGPLSHRSGPEGEIVRLDFRRLPHGAERR